MDFIEVFRENDDLTVFEEGETSLREGEEGDFMYVLVEGEADISLEGKVLGQASPGDLIGEMALIQPTYRSATIKAVTECKVAVIDQKSFSLIVKHVPEFSLHLVQVLAARLREAYDHIEAKPGIAQSA